MRRTPVFIVLLLTMESSLIACKRSKETEGKPPRPVPRSMTDAGIGADTPNGSLGHNGLKPIVYRDNKFELKNRVDEVLTPATNDLNGKFSKIFGGPSGLADSTTFINYAISCAVPLGTVTLYAGGAYDPSAAYTSSGNLLKTTGGWSSTKLAAAASLPSPPHPSPREDLYTCLATRMNPSGEEVTFWMAGQNVTEDPAPHSGYDVDEALWTTREQPNEIDIYVWPSPSVVASCPHDQLGAIPAINTRVCPTSGTCGLQPPRDWATCNKSGTPFFSCPDPLIAGSNTSVIQTKLSCDDWCKFYPSCKKPAECDVNTPPCIDRDR